MLAWEIEGLIMAGCDDLTHMKNSSANLIVYVLNSARVVCEDRYAHFFLQLKALTSFPDNPVQSEEIGRPARSMYQVDG